ncbi:MAG: hypothetical protein HC936_05615 [Leptolyngbyaceae cyanobacterium SU_3_3]|nr:hypothetical protein [Leptolyngbyaceae cyanobacterium SU_3_3]
MAGSVSGVEHSLSAFILNSSPNLGEDGSEVLHGWDAASNKPHHFCIRFTAMPPEGAALL